ncbi:hypothetical protein HCN51_20405 [Nonomuraea sp. FMUSA5-5]|uniref:Uncharacterized protein n=1 Tax=Nonomuraea composti TaxID=2720023 RepID=A0ABX1B5L1_9ACTN|nr:hypothetical protein [Nonomuraea sp. FMUSA5-5]NJP91792.1 hypothetical protein [Nonomuraea sp. FMUSA5-5]
MRVPRALGQPLDLGPLLWLGAVTAALLRTPRAQRQGYGDLVAGILLSADVSNSLGGGAIAALTTHRAPAVVVTMVTVSVSAGIADARG